METEATGKKSSEQGPRLRFRKTAAGDVVMTQGDKTMNVSYVAAAFPLSDPGRMVSVRDEAGKEITIIENINKLDRESMRLLNEMLEKTYFIPEITGVNSVKEKGEIVSWEVETDKGARTFEVRNVRQDVRRLGAKTLVIKDVDRNRYRINDLGQLPVRAQRLIYEYL